MVHSLAERQAAGSNTDNLHTRHRYLSFKVKLHSNTVDDYRKFRDLTYKFSLGPGWEANVCNVAT